MILWTDFPESRLILSNYILNFKSRKIIVINLANKSNTRIVFTDCDIVFLEEEEDTVFRHFYFLLNSILCRY